MRLYLAVAVLMLAFVAYTEAQDETFEEKMAKLGTQMQERFQVLAESAKSTFDQIQASETVTNARNGFTDLVEKLKAQFTQ